MNKVVVFIRGGVLEDVVDLDGNAVDYHLIDYDNLEGGDCQLCYGETEIKDPEKVDHHTVQMQATRSYIRDDIGYPYEYMEPAFDKSGKPIMEDVEVTYTFGGQEWCPHCEFDWSDPSQEEILARLRKLEGQNV